jgi:hypothetical protein
MIVKHQPGMHHIRCISGEILEVLEDLKFDVEFDPIDFEGRWTFLPDRTSSSKVIDIAMMHANTIIDVLKTPRVDDSDHFVLTRGSLSAIVPITSLDFRDKLNGSEALNSLAISEGIDTASEFDGFTRDVRFAMTYNLALRAGLIKEIAVEGSPKIKMVGVTKKYEKVFRAKREGKQVGMHYVPPFLRELKHERYTKNEDGTNKIVVVCGHYRGSESIVKPDIKQVTD